MKISTAMAQTMDPDSVVCLSGVQCQALLDSLRRARQATQMCGQIAGRALAAFQHVLPSLVVTLEVLADR